MIGDQGVMLKKGTILDGMIMASLTSAFTRALPSIPQAVEQS
jgi:hypothetical protein